MPVNDLSNLSSRRRPPRATRTLRATATATACRPRLLRRRLSQGHWRYDRCCQRAMPFKSPPPSSKILKIKGIFLIKQRIKVKESMIIGEKRGLCEFFKGPDETTERTLVRRGEGETLLCCLGSFWYCTTAGRRRLLAAVGHMSSEFGTETCERVADGWVNSNL